ncbi:MAG: MRP family ATP-binding protein [Rhodothermaceae bacterium]|nr:MRP family ATP-binding protein [Rhodothermaceae bacterium]MBC11806.1 MRP family ATP-binding protein [Rhodothermaceae bacterium]
MPSAPLHSASLWEWNRASAAGSPPKPSASMSDAPRPQKPRGVSQVTNFIAVASGKGGVGKSTVAANLAAALAASGAKVGLLDADVYGPSVPLMFGVPEDEKPRLNDERHIVPLLRYGVKLLSMGFLVDEKNAVIWRGPMVSSAVRQFLSQAAWGELDHLVIDLPPGTGDIQLTLVQTVPLTGAVVVSTPQPVALADARKAVKMFENVHVPVLGVVENMAYFTPPDLPDRKYFLFGEAGAQKLAAELDVPVLGEIPIEQAAREAGDRGTPVVLSEPDSVSAKAFRAMAERVVAEVERRNADAPPTLPIEILYK